MGESDRLKNFMICQLAYILTIPAAGADPHMCFFLVSDAMRTGGHYDKTQLRIIDGQQKIQEYDFPVDLFDP